MKREIMAGEQPTEVLRIPYFSQANTDALCLCWSLKMCLEYFKNIYSDERTRRDLDSFSIDEIVEFTKTRSEIGTKIGGSLISTINQKIPVLITEMRYGVSLERIASELARNLPVIAIYDGSMLTYSIRGPAHAGVVIGLTDNSIVLNNPWLGPERVISKIDFECAWEVEFNQAIFLRPNPQTQLREWENAGTLV
jgi:hypothetical protein